MPDRAPPVPDPLMRTATTSPGARPHPCGAPMRCCVACHAIYRSDFLRCPTDGAALEPCVVDPIVGTTIAGHYVVEACVGEGAMGRVYRAHHSRLARRRFALKI